MRLAKELRSTLTAGGFCNCGVARNPSKSAVSHTTVHRLVPISVDNRVKHFGGVWHGLRRTVTFLRNVRLIRRQAGRSRRVDPDHFSEEPPTGVTPMNRRLFAALLVAFPLV